MEFFEPVGLGHTIFRERYARHAEETWLEACRRVATHVANAEENGKIKLYEERFFEQLASNRFNPGGRIWYGAGRPKAQLLNCFVVPAGDSREAWGRTASDVIIISGLMGGVGINLSPIRARGSAIKGTGGVATGAVSYGQLINGIGDTIVGGGGRRMALMLCLDVDHPDIEEFLEVKLDLAELNNANISVVINVDIVEFQRKVQENEDIEFTFGGVNVVNSRGNTKINARDLWNKIVQHAWENGEPGVLNGALANSQNNIWYHKPLISTNPCGEIWLEEYGCCDLGALVLPRFIDNGVFDWDALDESIRLGVRFLDDVLTVNHYPLEEIKENCENVRRIGLGVMGLHSMLLELGMKYSSDEAHEFIDRLFSTIKNTAYDASCTLAAEKGPFPAYQPELLESGFAKTLKRGIRNKIREHGLRNCALLTIAPTGTTSMVAGVTSGIEPLPAPVYWRTYFASTQDGRRERAKELVVAKEYSLYPEIVEGAADLHPRHHFEVQKIVQRHIDNAVSKTINLPGDYSQDELAEIWLEYLPHMKGSTFYRWGSREYEPISPVPLDKRDKVISENGDSVTFEYNVDEMLTLDCPGGTCDLPYQWAKQGEEIPAS